MYVYENSGFFKNRVYIYDDPAQLNAIFSKGIEHQGAGFTTYPSTLGKFLNKINLSAKVTLNGENHYVNPESFRKFADRGRQLIEEEHFALIDDTVERLHDIYSVYDGKSHKNIRIPENLDQSFYSNRFNIDGISHLRS